MAIECLNLGRCLTTSCAGNSSTLFWTFSKLVCAQRVCNRLWRRAARLCSSGAATNRHSSAARMLKLMYLAGRLSPLTKAGRFHVAPLPGEPLFPWPSHETAIWKRPEQCSQGKGQRVCASPPTPKNLLDGLPTAQFNFVASHATFWHDFIYVRTPTSLRMPGATERALWARTQNHSDRFRYQRITALPGQSLRLLHSKLNAPAHCVMRLKTCRKAGRVCMGMPDSDITIHTFPTCDMLIHTYHANCMFSTF